MELPMRTARMAFLVIVLLLASKSAWCETHADLVEQVRVSETAFAKSMADRNLEVFSTFLADEALFFNDASVLRGKDAIIAGWSPYFDGDAAPFSWSSETIEVLDSGTLAHSSGPVFSPDGKQVGIFNSVWRRKADGQWKVVFDKGCQACD